MNTLTFTHDKRGGLTRRERAMLRRYLSGTWTIQALAKLFNATSESDIKRQLGTALLKLAGEQRGLPMPDETTSMQLIQQAIQVLPPRQQADYTGIAWEWLADNAQELSGADEAKIVSKLRNHLKYQYRKDRSHNLSLAIDVPANSNGAVDEVELADELAALTPQDRSIVAMILAGDTFRDVAKQTGISTATVSRAIKRMKQRFNASGAGPAVNSTTHTREYRHA